MSGLAESNNITAKVGSEFSLHVVENGTTGFTWKQSIEDGSNCVQFLRNQRPNKGMNATRFGGGRSLSFVFKATTEGKATIVLTHSRSWEKNDPLKMRSETKTYSITISK